MPQKYPGYPRSLSRARFSGSRTSIVQIPGIHSLVWNIPSGDMESKSVDDFLRTVWSAPDDDLPLATASAALVYSCDILRDNEMHGVLSRSSCRTTSAPLFVCGNRCIVTIRGRAKECFRKSMPDGGIGTSAAIPETLAPIFLCGGYQG